MDLNIKMFADGADLEEIRAHSQNPLVTGFTTNPTLMRKAGVHDYASFARDAAQAVFPKPISFEVFGDDSHEMVVQARKISSWGTNIYVKIPVTNTKGVSSSGAISELSGEGIKLNITAIMTMAQVESTVEALDPSCAAVVSVFAGRIADTGVDPMPLMVGAKQVVGEKNFVELLWASPREILNLLQADSIGCDIITMTADLWKKLPGLGKDLSDFSLETVKMFFDDAAASNYSLD